MNDQYAGDVRYGVDAPSSSGGAPSAGGDGGRNGARGDTSTADLIRAASEQVSQLVRQELRLAGAEVAYKGKKAGGGAGLFGAAALLAFYGGGAMVVMVGFLLAYAIPAWAAALVTAALLFLLAGLCALLGRSQVRRAGNMMPEQAMASASADVHTVVHAAKGGEH